MRVWRRKRYPLSGDSHKGLKVQRLPVRTRCRRARLLLVLGGAWACLLATRLVLLQCAGVELWEGFAAKQHRTKFTLASVRGPIVDRRGELLAFSVPAGSVYAHPRQIADKEETAAKIAPLLKISQQQALRKLSSPSPFVWLQRQASLQQARAIEKLGLKGLGFFHESSRVYPRGAAGSVLIGRVGVDGQGLSGLELQHDEQLMADAQTLRVTKDAAGNLIQGPGAASSVFKIPEGHELALTLDAEIQEILQEELDWGKEYAGANNVVGVMVNARTGEVLAMGQTPSPDFNEPKLASASMLRNRVAETVFEPGSIMKPIVAAAALEAGVVKPNEIIDCEEGRYRVGKHLIKDVHPIALVPFHEVVVQSSNIGMSKIGERLGPDRLYYSLKSFGFGDASGLNFPGESAGILRHPSKWAQVDVATHSFGQGVAVTPLQIVRAISTIANGGLYTPLTLLNGKASGRPYRALSYETARIAKEMMYGVVEHERGTGKNARISGVRVGGKTGTAQKARVNGRGYAPGKYIASFVGFVDASNLEIEELLTLVISVDEPSKRSIYGGTLAAPVFKRVMSRTLHLLATRRQIGGELPPAIENPPLKRTFNVISRNSPLRGRG